MKVRDFVVSKDNIQQQFKQVFPAERIHAIRALIDFAYESADALYQYQPNERMYNLLQETKVEKESGQIYYVLVSHVRRKCSARKVYCRIFLRHQ